MAQAQQPREHALVIDIDHGMALMQIAHDGCHRSEVIVSAAGTGAASQRRLVRTSGRSSISSSRC